MTGNGKTDKKISYSATSDFSSVYMSVTAFDLYHYSDQWSFS